MWFCKWFSVVFEKISLTFFFFITSELLNDLVPLSLFLMPSCFPGPSKLICRGKGKAAVHRKSLISIWAHFKMPSVVFCSPKLGVCQVYEHFLFLLVCPRWKWEVGMQELSGWFWWGCVCSAGFLFLEDWSGHSEQRICCLTIFLSYKTIWLLQQHTQQTRQISYLMT